MCSKIFRYRLAAEYLQVTKINTIMTVRVYNGQLSWVDRAGVQSLEPPEGWITPDSICAYYKSLVPRDRRALMDQLIHAEMARSAEEDRDELAYELARLANRPLT
jgi:hypothetical protein